MLIAFKVVGVPPDFGDHVLQTRVVCKHAVGTLEERWRTTVRLPVHTRHRRNQVFSQYVCIQASKEFQTHIGNQPKEQSDWDTQKL